MDVLHAALTRRSIRKFLDIPVEMEKIGHMLEAAKHTPSAGNLQPWKFILITDEDMRKKLGEACLQQHWISRAPVHIVVVAEPHKPKRFYGERGEKLYAFLECGAAIENMLLTAHEDGLGTCWVSAFEEEMLNRELGIPGNVKPVALIAIGYPDEIVQTPPKFLIENLTYVESWGSSAKDFGAYYGYTSQHVQRLIKEGKLLLKKVTEKLERVK